MSFFNNGDIMVEGSIDQLMENKRIQPSFYDDFIEGAFAIVAESTENENRLMRAIGINEASYFAQTGEEYIYTEGTLSDIWAKVKSIINKIKEKVLALIKRFVAMFDKFFASDKEFVKKYKKRIMLADTKDVSYEGYKFPGLNKKYTVESVPSEAIIPIGVVKDEDHMNEILDGMRGNFCNTSSVSAGDFSSECKEYVYGDKETMDGSELEVSKQVSYIENYAENKKEVEKFRTAAEKFYKAIIRKLDEIEKDFTKDKDLDGDEKAIDPTEASHSDTKRNIVKNIGFKRTIATRTAEIYATATGIYLQALKDRNRQARAICVKVMSKGGTLQKESTSFEYPAYGSSFLENVKFI